MKITSFNSSYLIIVLIVILSFIHLKSVNASDIIINQSKTDNKINSFNLFLKRDDDCIDEEEPFEDEDCEEEAQSKSTIYEISTVYETKTITFTASPIACPTNIITPDIDCEEDETIDKQEDDDCEEGIIDDDDCEEIIEDDDC